LEFRFLKHPAQDGFTNMAIDEAIAQTVSKTGKPTIRFYSWKPAAVSIGYFQGMKQEVNLEECRNQKIDAVRRLTGGGAVFHEEELTYSFSCPIESRIVSDNILESYKKICGALVNGFSEMGLKAEFAPLNDVVAEGKKISGNAQTRRFEAVLQHGTILLKVDVEKMFSILRVPDEKIKDKLVKSVKQRVTSLEQLLERNVSFEETAKAMKQGFEQEFEAKLVEGSLSEEEKQLAGKVKEERFSKEEWNFKR